jgi:hypothetical protein
MRVNGKFMVGSETPGGQTAIIELLEDCYGITRDLAEQADSDSDD